MIRSLAVVFALCNIANGQQITVMDELRVISFEDKVYHVHVLPWHVWYEEKDGPLWYAEHPKHGLCVRLGEWHAWLLCPSVLYKDACNAQHLDYLLHAPHIDYKTDVILQKYGDTATYSVF